MRNRIRHALFTFVVVSVMLPHVCGSSFAYPVPSDVPTRHWARAAVIEALRNGVMSLPDGHDFHGEAKVTRAQAAIALARLAKALESGRWQPLPSIPPTKQQSVRNVTPDWRHRPVTRYEMAVILTRFGDYIANGIPRPPADAKDLAQSTALPDRSKVTVSPRNPAYPALAYLADHRMVHADSPLLKANDQPIRGAELSAALAQMTDGLVDVLTPLGHDENGSTIDSTTPRPDRTPAKH